jgi:hypothetical protein
MLVGMPQLLNNSNFPNAAYVGMFHVLDILPNQLVSSWPSYITLARYSAAILYFAIFYV